VCFHLVQSVVKGERGIVGRGWRFGTKASVEDVVLVGRLHQVVSAYIVAVDVKLCCARAEVGESEATQHPVHAPLTHEGAIEYVAAQVKLFHAEEGLRRADVDEEGHRLYCETSRNGHCTLATRTHPHARTIEVGKNGTCGVRDFETGKVPVDLIAHMLLLVLPSADVLLKCMYMCLLLIHLQIVSACLNIYIRMYEFMYTYSNAYTYS
jgi:hypothetical protein